MTINKSSPAPDDMSNGIGSPAVTPPPGGHDDGPSAVPLALRIHLFFEHPSSLPAHAVRIALYLLIVASVASTVVETWYPEVHARYADAVGVAEYVVLAIFTVEYLTRLLTAPRKGNFATRPMNIIDLVAIVPGLVGLALPLTIRTNEVRALRVLRVLRFMRLLRVLRFLRLDFFGKLFQYENTILQAIAPIIAVFVILKSGFWLLEWAGFWSPAGDLGELFAIIGFALGIVLAQKVAATYQKFLLVQEAEVTLARGLSTLATWLDYHRSGQGSQAVSEWAKVFLTSFRSTGLKSVVTSDVALTRAGRRLYNLVGEVEPNVADIAVLYSDIMRTSVSLLHQRNMLTPKPYDSLLRQATVLYICLLTVFIPGWAGLLSVAVATYVLYGMFHLTQDLDTIIGGEFRLISITLADLEGIVQGEHAVTADPPSNDAIPESAAQGRAAIGR